MILQFTFKIAVYLLSRVTEETRLLTSWSRLKLHEYTGVPCTIPLTCVYVFHNKLGGKG